MDEIDIDRQARRLVGEDEACEVIAVGILLPVEEMFLGLKPQ